MGQVLGINLEGIFGWGTGMCVCYTLGERSRSMENRFTAVFERTEKWWIAYVEELPGANTQGATLEEARENLKEAVAMVLEANRELAERRLSGKDVVREELVVVSA